MVKNDCQILEENRNESRAMSLSLQAQIDILQRKILATTTLTEKADQNYIKRESMIAQLKNQKKGHDEITEQFDKMIAAEEKAK